MCNCCNSTVFQGVCLIILMAQAVAEAEQEVYEGAGPIRASIVPKNGSENSSSAAGQKTLQKSIKPRVAPRRAMWPYWLMKKTSHTTQRCRVKIIPTDQKTGFLIGHWKIWSQADIAWPFQVNFSWFRGRKGSLISNNSAQSIKQLQLVLLIFSLVLCWPMCWTDSTISTRQRFLILKKYQLNLGYLSDQGLCGENEEGDDGRELKSYWGKLVQGRSTKVRDFLRFRSQPKFQPLCYCDVQRSWPFLVNLFSIQGLADWILWTTMWTETIMYFVIDCK